MKAPDKIYIHEASAPELALPVKEYHIEYIRKDLVEEMLKTAEDHAYFAGKEKMREGLLEWLNIVKKQSEQLKDDGYSDIFYGAQIAILEEVIKKINNYEHH